ncbi:division/cell wall cluster transcriptional repressor MraZ [Patescibacteria group bacterium]|nr:division/cell wall cluster transcriptional repressor MraZ [Patescibacteria group bacterium]MBU1246902.1 division/cell wall cluster transcriptional repressor MraZ [Patescibacteria group bacterium]MBU1519738.1 division/cell wall cluster transcriptional repressor MraZ [Patescibacteria group bacterium]MBU1730085.1 division/cell wall cluster transcriptional repressor MraZ [Patescibacteria group bacterium]MBU1956728.1 division/cell wall cluster transcriptional repressor MraZ [Patescibacteria group
MLIGEYTHTLDEKRRLSLPSKFRKEIGKKVVITKGLEGCLFVYSTKQWEKVTSKLTGLSLGQANTRDFNRYMLGSAVETDVDPIGRILVPDFLKYFANLQSKVSLIGVHDRIEIWNEKAWTNYKGRVEKQADVLAEKLGEIGAI